MKRTTLALITLIVAATISVGAYYSRRSDIAPALTTEAVSRGSIVSLISATGTLQAVTTVQVGSQVSGSVLSLGADYNQLVRKGDILATLDQSLYASAVEQAQAALVSAEAEAERLRVAQTAAAAALTRARELSARQLLASADLQSAETASQSAAAQVIGADAKTLQARSAVKTAQVNLAKTVIASPIDGVVIARNVDVGQTVAASLSAPTLFVIAADLSKMQLNTNIDESDLGAVSAGQAVTFRVDAYPSQTFRGVVSQVRLNPTTVQNVVTYAAIIDAPNPEMTLKPGMTANVTIEVARRDDVMRVPAAALRFKPAADVLEHFGVARTAASPAGKSATVWISGSGTLAPAAVTTGASDGTFTEIVNAPFAEGALVVTRASTASATAAKASPANGNPLMPAQRGPGGPR
ncbi:MAG TPA: efflux RND transporter periplasmic adaptor subunit [Vicinamibacterales bacterium]|nr:efflux RND transporter periplasmic adaptor subunit [Vicinamibacterales bacterium]